MIKTQQKVIDYQTEQKHNDLNVLIVIDDFANHTDFTGKSQLLHQLYVRGRHYMISIQEASTQVYKQTNPIVRKT